MRHKRHAALAKFIMGLGTLAVSLSAIETAFADPTPGEYGIGIISDDTGPIASAGISYHRGADLAVAEINKDGLAGQGVTLKLGVKDSGSDAARAVQAITQFASDRKILATTCCIITPNVNAVKPIAVSNAIPLVIYGATKPGIPEQPYVTSVVALPGPQEVSMAKRISADLKPQTAVYYVAGDNDIFVGRARDVQKIYESGGAKTVEMISTLSNDTDFTGPATQGMAHNPDMIVVMATQQPTVGIISALRQRGYKGTIVTSEVISTPAVFKKVGEIVVGIPFALSFQPGLSQGDKAQAFIKEFQGAYGELPDVYAAQGYTAIQYIAQALKTLSGKPTRQTLAEAMWKVTAIERNLYNGQTVVDGQAQIPATLIVNWKPDGKIVLWEKP
jgi:branched-chain amino acid transport system substrate-binding protein